MARLLFLPLLALASCGPSCEDQGGEMVFDHLQPIITMVGKVPIVQMIPIYQCKVPKPKETGE